MISDVHQTPLWDFKLSLRSTFYIRPDHDGTGFSKNCSFRPVFCDGLHFRHMMKAMRGWLIHWVLSGVALLVVANILPGIQVQGFGAALIAALVIGIVSATVGLLLKIILFPFAILTLGLVYLVVNGLMLMLASGLVSGFRVNGFLTAIFGSILLSVVDYVLTRLAGV